MRTSRSNVFLKALFVVLFVAAIGGGYLFFSKRFTPAQKAKQFHVQAEAPVADVSFVRVYYPAGDRLVMEERIIKRQSSAITTAEAVIEEYVKGTANAGKSYVPAGTKLLGAYLGLDRILYLDFSDELRRNFQGDIQAEFLVLKGIYDSVISNVQGINDIKLLIEGKEAETIGGHFSISGSLKNIIGEPKAADGQ